MCLNLMCIMLKKRLFAILLINRLLFKHLRFGRKYTYKFCNYLSSLNRLKNNSAKRHKKKPATPFNLKPQSFPVFLP